MLEKDLQKSINADLKKLGIKFFHCEKGRYNNSKQHRAGWPDLLIFPNMGYSFFVELKTNSKLKKEQLDFLKWCKDMKYKYYVVRNMSDWEVVKAAEGLLKV